MSVIVRKSKERDALFREVEKLVGLDSSVIGVKANGFLVRTSEKNFSGISGTYLSGNGDTIQKLLFLFGKNAANILSYRGGKLEICVS